MSSYPSLLKQLGVRLFQDTDLDDWTTKLVVVCTDGAAVNMGMYNSVVLKLWQLAAVAHTGKLHKIS